MAVLFHSKVRRIGGLAVPFVMRGPKRDLREAGRKAIQQTIGAR